MSFRAPFVLVLFAVFCPIGVTAQDVVVAAAQVQGLPVEKAALGKAVHLEGVMTFIDSDSGRAFMQDESGGVALRLNPQVSLPEDLRPGSRVIVEGVTAIGQFLPWVEGAGGSSPSITVLGEGSLPVAKPVNSAQLTLPNMDSQWIEIWGGRFLPICRKGRLLASFPRLCWGSGCACVQWPAPLSTSAAK
jgi:hypothetical protein